MNPAKIVYELGIRLRNPKIPERLAFLMDSQFWSLEKLQAHQTTKLRELLVHANEHSDYYRELFRRQAIDPLTFESLDDLARIPPLSKETLLRDTSRIQIKDGLEKLFYSETSGSTGKPLVFYRNMDWDAWHRASAFRGYAWHGAKPWDRNGYLWGYNFAFRKRLKTQILDLLQNRFRLFSYDNAEIDTFARKLMKSTYLSGYSSMIYEIAKRINATLPEDRKPRLKMVLGTSEKIFEAYQDEAEKAFGTRIISEYGAAETGIIAVECASGHMHINMETAIVEIVDEKILVTNLVSRSFPIIRYELGDYVTLDLKTECPCGRKHPIIAEVTGRIGQPIYGSRAQYPSLTLYYVFKNLAMEAGLVINYQAIQRKKGELELYVEGYLESGSRNLLMAEIKNYYSDDLAVTIFENADLSSRNRKKRDFVSELDA